MALDRQLERDLRRALRVDGERPPFAEFALTIFVFTRLLYDRLAAKGAQQVLFCSREGQLLQQLFERYQEGRPSTVSTGYLLISRRASLLPSLQPLAEEDFGRIIGRFPQWTNETLLRNLGLSDLVPRLPKPRRERFDITRLRQDPEIASSYARRRREQRALLRALVTELTGETGGPLHVVDVGFRGSIQDQLQSALGNSWDVQGYYVGLIHEDPIAHLGDKSAMLFGPTAPNDAHYRVFRHHKNIYEFLLAADHSSVKAYEGGPSGVAATFDHNEIELEEFSSVIDPIQNDLRVVFDQICGLSGLAHQSDDQLYAAAAKAHARILFFPTRRELELSASHRHYANLGALSVREPRHRSTSGPVATAVKAMRVLSAPGSIMTSWPALELHRQGLDWLIPMLGAYRHVREFGPAFLRSTGRRANQRRADGTSSAVEPRADHGDDKCRHTREDERETASRHRRYEQQGEHEQDDGGQVPVRPARNAPLRHRVQR